MQIGWCFCLPTTFLPPETPKESHLQLRCDQIERFLGSAKHLSKNSLVFGIGDIWLKQNEVAEQARSDRIERFQVN
jgi:hypothetical protein